MANFYPYWEKVAIDDAVCDLALKYDAMSAAAEDKAVWISETGWPSAGPQYGGAEPGPENAARYLLDLSSWAREKPANFLYFEAFDESWKVRAEGSTGAYWGIWDKYGAMKPGMQEIFAGAKTSMPCVAATPEIALTYLPPIGSHDDLAGKVANLDPADGAVAVYIRVAGGWWTKPTWGEPLTTIRGDGTWVCDITTGGLDETATEIAAFLVPSGYSPPLLSGASSLPNALNDDALHWMQVDRASADPSAPEAM